MNGTTVICTTRIGRNTAVSDFDWEYITIPVPKAPGIFSIRRICTINYMQGFAEDMNVNLEAGKAEPKKPKYEFERMSHGNNEQLEARCFWGCSRDARLYRRTAAHSARPISSIVKGLR